MSVWVVCPSARPVEHVRVWAQAWRERGYKIAIGRDSAFECTEWQEHGVDLCCSRIHYPGYAQAVNWLVSYLMQERSQAEWFIAAGDDIYPDPNKSADEIARECFDYFENLHHERTPYPRVGTHDSDDRIAIGTFGVMQPTGDRWGESPNNPDPKMRSAYIDRVAGSAWIGREFARRVNQGNGPLWPEYFHMGVDEELQAVATKLGVFWQRPDLTHLHQHWGRPKPGHAMGHRSDMPAFLERANSTEEWDKYKALFARRSAAGFPGSEPL